MARRKADSLSVHIEEVLVHFENRMQFKIEVVIVSVEEFSLSLIAQEGINLSIVARSKELPFQRLAPFQGELTDKV